MSYIDHLRQKRGLSTIDEAWLKAYDEGKITPEEVWHIDRLWHRHQALTDQLWISGFCVLGAVAFTVGIVIFAILSA